MRMLALFLARRSFWPVATEPRFLDIVLLERDGTTAMPPWFFRRFPKSAPAQPVSPPVPPAQQLPQQRRHREDVPYALPKDLEEGQRLNLQHYLFRYALRGNYAAPLPEGITDILDVGCGTGIWGQEMARLFPSARVFGLDLEPSQSLSLTASSTTVPSNYRFVQGNLLEGLPFPNATFQYTHQRMLVMGIPLERWPQAIRELMRVTRSEGWVEVLELGTKIHPAGPATSQLLAWSLNFLKTRGIDSSEMRNLGTMLSQCGLRSVTSHPLDIPLGSWDHHLGVLLEKDIVAAFRAIQHNTCQSEHIRPEQFEHFLQEAIHEWKREQASYRFYLAYGQV